VNDIEKLLAIEEIKNLKARYFRCVDTKDWPGFQAVFAPNARFDITDDVAGCVLVGPEIADEVSRLLAGCDSIHHGHCPEIEITSDTTATGIWAMEDLLRWATSHRTRLLTGTATTSRPMKKPAAAGISRRRSCGGCGSTSQRRDTVKVPALSRGARTEPEVFSRM
jgi:hypothetical protein